MRLGLMWRVLCVVMLTVLLTGCAGQLMGDDWQAAQAKAAEAQADAEAARAAAEWAHTRQIEAETVAAATMAPARAQADAVMYIALLVIGVLTAAGLGSTLVLWSWRRASLVFADKAGLYPVVIGATAATNLNEPGAQHARIAPHRTPVQVLPAPETDLIPLVPEPVVIDARRLEHIERLLLDAPARSVDHDSTD